MKPEYSRSKGGIRLIAAEQISSEEAVVTLPLKVSIYNNDNINDSDYICNYNTHHYHYHYHYS